FMLPIRLGTLNAKGKQELYVYALTRSGRVETTNYRTVKMPSDVDVPEFVQGEFAEFYRDMFTKQVKNEDERAVFLEYAWDMGWCDPCAADPLTAQELRKLGVFWVGGDQPNGRRAATNRIGDRAAARRRRRGTRTATRATARPCAVGGGAGVVRRTDPSRSTHHGEGPGKHALLGSRGMDSRRA
ncbi:MAG: DUF2330 domain-containing protein, partial [Nannocystaceae bacterium]|nr:DUF2330 domain-containing protein [Nannocystaceae bacterium]